MGATHFLKVCHGRKEGLPPRLDVGRELAVQNSVRELIRAGLVRSAHDCSEGGLAVALAESCFNPKGLFGAEIDLEPSVQNLFNESQSRIVISCAVSDAEKVLAILRSRNVPHGRLGEVTTKMLSIKASGSELSWAVETLYDDWFNAIRRAVESDAEPVRSL
jgi:phosphoribosylformylglycinamidine synthase